MRRNTRWDGMGNYLGHLKREPLSRESEIALSQDARHGDERAREVLINSHLVLVVAVASKFADRGARLDDLVQEGNIGLLKAIEHYDPKKGTRLATYAVWWIRAYIQRHLQENRSHVRGGDDSRPQVHDLWLDTRITEDGESTHLDRLVDEKADQELDYFGKEHNRDVRIALQRVRKRLGGLGWDILQERLIQEKPRTLEEIGKRWGVSRERVRQVEQKTKEFLARYLEPLAA